MEIAISEVTSPREMKEFIKFPVTLYRSDKNFVFEPIAFQKEFLSPKNPFFEHSSARFFLARSGKEVVGRIASIRNNNHNKTYSEKTGFFGLFECIEKYEVAQKLLDKVAEIHERDGFNRIVGPANLTTNDSCGILTAGFDTPPVVMMPYNKSYYDEYIIRYGFNGEMDLSSYFIENHFLISPRFEKILSRVMNKLSSEGISFRTINYKKLEQEMVSFRDVYNQSNEGNWGFVPMTANEFLHTAKQLRDFVPEKLIILCEKGPEQIGFIVGLPDINMIFRKIRSGRMFPLGYLRFLLHKNKINNSRILILGVLPEYRNKGIDLVLYKKIQENLASIGIHHGEACYVMENNRQMNSIMTKIGGRIVKRYRMYRYEI